MKLQIDTTNKVIKLEQSAKLTELFAIVKKLFPNDEWKQYTLEAVTYLYNWHNPVYIPSVWSPEFKQDQFEITCAGTNETFCVQTN